MPKPFAARLLPPGQLSLALAPSHSPLGRWRLRAERVAARRSADLRPAGGDRLGRRRGPTRGARACPGERRRRSPRRALRAKSEKQRALALLEQAASSDTGNKALLAEQGLPPSTSAKCRRPSLLRKAIDAKSPDWRLHSGLGAAISAQGRQAEAQVDFGKALALAPDHPSVLNNLALSYALEGKHEEAERLLRRLAQGAQQSQTRQNLALLLGLKGKIEEARKVSGRPAARPGARQRRLSAGAQDRQGERERLARRARAAASVASAERDARAQAAPPAEAASQPNERYEAKRVATCVPGIPPHQRSRRASASASCWAAS